MGRYEALVQELAARPRRWLVTGCAGFIGSHLAERLLQLGQRVVGLDDLSTGRESNLASFGSHPSFTLIRGDIRDPGVCRQAMEGADYVLHQAALGSVPRSIEHPRNTHEVNVDGFVNVALAARDAGVAGLVYASSSSVFGDSPTLPKREGEEGKPLSPYAASKRIDEIYAASFHACYGLRSVGLRYFNVVGPRQDPNGVYAAVVPRWLSQLARGEQVVVYGDGQTSRDFCPVDNVVRANLLAAVAPDEAAGSAFNIGLGARTTLLELYAMLRQGMAERGCPCADLEPRHEPPRKGDVLHSHADIRAARTALGFEPSVSLSEGLAQTMDAFLAGQR